MRRPRKLQSKHQAQEICDLLSAEFGVEPPRVVWRGGSRNGRYVPYGRQVILGPCAWRGVDCVLHEYAHHLAYVTFGYTGSTDARGEIVRNVNGRLSRGHGPLYHRALTLVALAWYGDETKYAWDTEYRAIAAAGPHRGGDTNAAV